MILMILYTILIELIWQTRSELKTAPFISDVCSLHSLYEGHYNELS